MGLRRAVLEQVFKVSTTQGMFSDIVHAYYASATAVAISPMRIGQIVWGSSAGTNKVYLGKAEVGTGTGTSAWTDITN